MPGTEACILVVDDDEDILVSARLLLKRRFGKVVTSQRPEEIIGLLATEPVDVILLDMNFAMGKNTGEEGFYWLQKILDVDPTAVVILITAYGGVDTAVKAMKEGATDFVVKPWHNEKLVGTLNAAVSLSRSRREADTLKKTNRVIAASTAVAQDLIGTSEPMVAVMKTIERAAPTDANVLILGENGTGKELVAHEIHARSLRADNVFMTVDLGAVTDTLFESELFGHKRGAFTDAREDRVGRLQAANGGTLFLDEIGNLPLHNQVKLLAVLEQRKVTPVGANRPVDIDVRVIAATNLPRSELMDEARFRQDLLYRLNTVELTLPALREKPGDVPLLVDHFLDVYARKYNRAKPVVSDAAMQALMAFSWPGNVRSLRHSVERAIILGDHEVLEPGDFSLPREMDGGSGGAGELSTLNLEALEHDAIERALREHGGNISHAAGTLGLTRAALYRRMEKHGL